MYIFLEYTCSFPICSRISYNILYLIKLLGYLNTLTTIGVLTWFYYPNVFLRHLGFVVGLLFWFGDLIWIIILNILKGTSRIIGSGCVGDVGQRFVNGGGLLIFSLLLFYFYFFFLFIIILFKTFKFLVFKSVFYMES